MSVHPPPAPCSPSPPGDAGPGLPDRGMMTELLVAAYAEQFTTGEPCVALRLGDPVHYQVWALPLAAARGLATQLDNAAKVAGSQLTLPPNVRRNDLRAT